jgi:Transposase DDE domain
MPTRKPLSRERTEKFLSIVFEEDLHAKRVQSLAGATLGVIHAAGLGIHAIGVGLANAEGLNSKHAVKQVDRLLSNTGIDIWQLFESWVPFVVGDRTEAFIALDWTDYDDDGQSTIAAHLITSHGRATPLVWKTVQKSQLRRRRNDFENEVLVRLAECLPRTVRATILADRGFGDQKLYPALEEWGLDFAIRFRAVIAVTDADGTTKSAGDWVPSNGRPKMLVGALVTADKTPVKAVVCTKAKGMKQAWCIATSRADLGAAGVVKLYGRRFTIEEQFRDTKDLRFGMGLSWTHIGTPERRDRLLFVGALAVALITLLGAAGESLGMERLMKANTVKTRTYSLFRQGLHYYSALPMMKQDSVDRLLPAFAALVAAQPICRDAFGLI